MIKPEELYQYMLNQMTEEQRANKELTEFLPVIVKGIIIAVQNSGGR
jgi:hypothetical protein